MENKNKIIDAKCIVVDEKKQKTIASILGDKILEIFEKSSLKQVIFWAIETFLIVLIMALFIAPLFTVKAVLAILFFKQFIVVKFVIVACAVKKRQEIKKALAQLKFKKDTNLLCGIPKKELCHYLFESGSFKLEATQKKFGLNRREFDKLAKSLEDNGVLVRGENNARVLSNELTRQEIYSMILNAKDPSGIKKTIGGYVYGKRANDTASVNDIENELETVFNIKSIY